MVTARRRPTARREVDAPAAPTSGSSASTGTPPAVPSEPETGAGPHGVEHPASRHRRFARGRLAAVSVGAAMAAGAWVGLATGLLLGSGLGAAIAWFAGAILAWQQDLGLTLGVVRNLLPFGDQAPVLRSLSNYWYLVIPGVALVSGVVGAVVTGLIGGLIAAAYNRSPRHATVLVELPPPLEPDEPHRASEDDAEAPTAGRTGSRTQG